MQRYYDTIAEFKREGLDIIVDKTYEDMHPRDSFDDSVCDLEEIIKDIDRGHLDWFMLRVRVLVQGLPVAEEWLGGCLYEDAREVLSDGTAEDIISQAMTSARQRVKAVSQFFTELSLQVDTEQA
jgi:hypothetical protein